VAGTSPAVGEVVPTVIGGDARTGEKACRVVLTGHEERSELILGGNGGASANEELEFGNGAEGWYGFSFKILRMVYGRPGAHNLIMQFKSDGEGPPNFGLQLWNFAGEKGLWTGGRSQEISRGGERFLAPVAPRRWHDVQLHFHASSHGTGSYRLFLDGRPIDSHKHVSMIVPGHASAYIKTGLYRNPRVIPGRSELLLDSVKLGPTRESVLPD
jgi:Polysaccharide lyase